ncbi:unnamed protein product [Parajaminaea phylloscopi]
MGDEKARRIRVVTNALQAALKQRRHGQGRAKSKVNDSGLLDSAVGLEDVQEAAEYWLEDVSGRGIALPSPGDNSQAGSDSQLDLTALEAHPLHEPTCSTLIELLGFEACEETTAAASFVVEDILDELSAPIESDAEEERFRHERGSLGTCELCTRSMPLTAHHLIPKSEHDRILRQREPAFTLQEMRTRFAWLCRPCHSAVHKLVDSRAMADQYNTLERLEELEAVTRWAKYASGLKERSKGYEGFGLRNQR